MRNMCTHDTCILVWTYNDKEIVCASVSNYKNIIRKQSLMVTFHNNLFGWLASTHMWIAKSLGREVLSHCSLKFGVLHFTNFWIIYFSNIFTHLRIYFSIVMNVVFIVVDLILVSSQIRKLPVGVNKWVILNNHFSNNSSFKPSKYSFIVQLATGNMGTCFKASCKSGVAIYLCNSIH